MQNVHHCRGSTFVAPMLSQGRSGCWLSLSLQHTPSSHRVRFLLVFAVNELSGGTWHCCNSLVTPNFSTQTRSQHWGRCGLAPTNLLAEDRLIKREHSCVVMKHAAKFLASFAKGNADFYRLNKVPPRADFQSISL